MAEFFETYYPYWAQVESGLFSQGVEDGIKCLRERSDLHRLNMSAVLKVRHFISWE
jgi:hypothetical protein